MVVSIFFRIFAPIMEKYVGNIVTPNTKVKMEGLKVCSDISEIDPSLPTLIIGWKRARDIINERTDGKFSILTKNYPFYNLYWTFSVNEKAVDYDEDVEEFYNMAIRQTIGDVQYRQIRVHHIINRERLLKIARICLDNTKERYVYIQDKRFAFIYIPHLNIVWGLSLSTCAYYGIHPYKLSKLLRRGQKTVSWFNMFNLPKRAKRIFKNEIELQLVYASIFGME